MQLKKTHETRQGGFTLIELLVVMGIIAILVALTAAVVFKAMNKADDARTRNDISQLALSVQNFQTAFNVKYIPSRFVLYKDLNHYGNSQLEQDSLQYLQQLWPRLRGQPYQVGNYVGNYINWDGAVPPTPPVNGDPPIILEGDQCLVFFLGGIPSNNVGPNPVTTPINPTGAMTLGFSADPTDPSLPPSPAANPPPPRKGPFYEFPSNRLYILPNRALNVQPAGSNLYFFSYQDGYGKNVYAYFSSYKSANNYLRYAGTPPNSSDCPSIGNPMGANGGVGVSPYAQQFINPNNGIGTFLNPGGFQIISAGRDGFFGRGSMPGWGAAIWTPANADSSAALATMSGAGTGADDMSNFHNTLLGVGQ